jgi:syntaxin 1B/2/3
MIRRLEQELKKVLELVLEVQEAIQQQEPAVENIVRDAGNVHQDLENANTQLTGAISSARKARRWKWYALIIVSKFIHGNSPNSHDLKADIETSHHHCHHRGCCCRCHRELDIALDLGQLASSRGYDWAITR